MKKKINDGGLLCAENAMVYNELETEIIENYNVSYLNNTTLLPNLKEKVFEPRRLNNNIPLKWTNNNNESYNRTIKQNNDCVANANTY